MTTRNETRESRDSRQQAQYTNEQGASSQQTGQQTGQWTGGSETRSDRERGLQTGREGASQSGVVRSGRPGWGLAAGEPARSPFSVVRRMMEDMDRIFEDFGFGRDVDLARGLVSPFFGGAGTDLWGRAGDAEALWSPPVEVLEKGDNLVVRAEIPGVSKDDVNVTLSNDTLTIEGERRQESEDRGEGFYRSERSYGRFLRTIPLPEGVDTEKVDASFKDGVLEVTVPLVAPQERTRRVPIAEQPS